MSLPSPRAAWAARLNAVAYHAPMKARALLDALGSDGLGSSKDSDWAAAAEIGPDRAARWRQAALAFDVDGERRRVEALGARLLAHGEPGYPPALADLPDAPLVLYAWGPLEDRTAVAVVGSRGPSEYGRRMARRVAGDLARRRVAIVSGLARGIDSEAHEAALKAGGVTWGVLGSGLGRLYPPENRDLVRRIVESGGCVLTEYPLHLAPRRELLRARNRVIAGLSCATVLVEGGIKSGALITARNAGEYGREVLAVPGPADSPLAAAPHKLLREGARIACGADDVLNALPVGAAVGPAAPGPVRRLPPLEDDEAKVLGVLGSESLSLDELSETTGLDMGRLSLIMFGLEIKDLVSSVPGQRYAQKTL